MTATELMTNVAAVTASIGGVACMFTSRTKHVAGAALLLLGWLGLLVALLPAALTERPALLAAAAAVTLAAGWITAGRLIGREHWLLAAGAVVLVLRVPVPTGDGESAMLLAPLYAVIALGTLVLVRGTRRRSAPSPTAAVEFGDRGIATRLLDVSIAALPVLAALSLTWSLDRDVSIESLTFFFVPFFLAFVLVRTWLRDGVALRPAALALVAMAVVAALVGIYQHTIYEVWWNPKVINANQFRADFRTNSVFWDPNIYGRSLVVGMLALIAWFSTAEATRRQRIGASILLAVLTAGLWFTYSQSSWLALGAAATLLALLTLPPHARRWVAGGVVVLALAAIPLASGLLGDDEAQARIDVARDGIELSGERPVLGWGIGAFEAAAQDRARQQRLRDPGLTASHTTPVTMLVELGAVGAAAYAMVLVSALLAALKHWRRTSSPAAAARARGDAGAERLTGWPIAPVMWATGVLLAIFTHSLLYAGFFEDATLWVALAVLAGLPRLTSDATSVEPSVLRDR